MLHGLQTDQQLLVGQTLSLGIEVSIVILGPRTHVQTPTLSTCNVDHTCGYALPIQSSMDVYACSSSRCEGDEALLHGQKGSNILVMQDTKPSP